MEADNKRHLGDGVYVDFDGYGFTIAVNDHRNVVAHLDPDVIKNFTEYIKEMQAR